MRSFDCVHDITCHAIVRDILDKEFLLSGKQIGTKKLFLETILDQ